MAINNHVLSKKELLRIVKKFLEDYDRGISMRLFAELSGMSEYHLKDVFLYQTKPLTETVQRRVNKAYHAYVNGEVRVMQNQDQTRFVEYRREAKPVFTKSTSLTLTSEGIKISLGIKPKYNYKDLTLDEQLKRG